MAEKQVNIDFLGSSNASDETITKHTVEAKRVVSLALSRRFIMVTSGKQA